MNRINLYMGCMYSVKTSELIKECRKAQLIKKKVLTINYIGDNRYSENSYAMSHNMDKVECIKVSKLSDIPNNQITTTDYIFIDEAQFYPDLLEYVLFWGETYKKSIYVFGLVSDYKRNKFGQILDLIPYCDKVHKLDALCIKCNDGTEAIFSHRLSNEAEQNVIGSSNYISVCRKHYLDLTNKDC
jgi:thymidine kinase